MLPHDRRPRCAVIDIGSNSVRLVIFDISEGYPHPLYNERVVCALGTGVGRSGTLPDDAMNTALVAIVRFVHLAEAAGVTTPGIFATAAVRDASNGKIFLNRVRKETGCPARILGGEEEAELAAQGVLFGLRVRNGVVADLGGGSLELAQIRKGGVRKLSSLPIGTMRLAASTRGNMRDMAKEIDTQLDRAEWLVKAPGGTLLTVGGAWRAFARLHISETGYPLSILHGYMIKPEAAYSTAQALAALDEEKLVELPDVVARRRETIPLTGLIMVKLMDRMKPRQVTVAGIGVREGYVCADMDEKQVTRDPLISGARGLARREGRYGDTADAFMEWLEPLFPAEKKERLRLRRAACALSDISWREHPDHRAAYAFERSIQHPFLGITHSERVFLALSLFTRYGGKANDSRVTGYSGLLSRRMIRRAQIIGHALQLGHRISAGNPEILARTSLRSRDNRLSIRLPGDGIAPHMSRIERSFKRLCEARQQRPGPVIVGGQVVRHPFNNSVSRSSLKD